MNRRITQLTIVLVLALAGLAHAADPGAVLTEIRRGKGGVAVKVSGDPDWKPARPLMSLRPGDQVRAEADARAVLVLTGGGARTVTAENSPFVVTPPSASGGSENVKTMVTGVAQYLAGKQGEPTYLRLTSRSLGAPAATTPVIVSPRGTRILSAPVTFVWTGGESLRYTVEVVGPGGRVWSASDLPRAPVTYPSSAPALRPGVSYEWVLIAGGFQPLRARFEIVSQDEASRIQSSLRMLEPRELAGYPRSTVTLLRAGLLASERLYQDALDELTDNLGAAPDEPTIHFVMGQLYDQIGLRHLAEQAFARARSLEGRAQD